MNILRSLVPGAALAALLLAGPAVADLAADPTFGDAGTVAVDFATSTDQGQAAAVQADGKLVIAGGSAQPPAGQTAPVLNYVAVLRLLADGTPDPDFDGDGRLVLLPGPAPTAAGTGAQAAAVLVQPDGRIVIAGAWVSGANAAPRGFVVRLTTDGALDPDFGTGGAVIFQPTGFFRSAARALALQSDGSLLVAGGGEIASGNAGFVLRLTPGGQVDGSFAAAGQITVPDPDPNGAAAAGIDFSFRALRVLPAGDGFVVAGGGGDSLVAGYTASGGVDAGFGNGGRTVVDLGFFSNSEVTAGSTAISLARQSDGRWVVGSRRAVGTASEAVLFRLSASGSRDNGFGTNGQTVVPSGQGGAPFGLVALSNDDLVVSGTGIPVVQVSRSGLAQARLAVADATALPALVKLAGDSVLAAGTRAGRNTPEPARTQDFLAAAFTTSPLDDVADTTPDAFDFVNVPDRVPLDTTQGSAAVTITDLTAPAPISITDGAYCIGDDQACPPVNPDNPDQNNNRFTTLPGVIQEGQQVRVRQRSALTGDTTVTTVLTIGGVSGDFRSTTVPPSTAPFDLGERLDVALFSTQISNVVTVTLDDDDPDDDLAPTAAISVAGDVVTQSRYSIGCDGRFTQFPGRVKDGDTVCVAHVSSRAGDTEAVSTLTIAGRSGTFRSRTVAIDNRPDPFPFPDRTDAPIAALVTSDPVTITGMASGAEALVSVENGEFSIGCNGVFRPEGVLAPIRNGQTVCVRHTSSTAALGGVETTLTIADVTGTFTSTTLNADLFPDRFEFATVTGAEILSEVTSVPVIITGIDGPAAVSVRGDGSTRDRFSIGCTDTFDDVPARIENGQTLCIRHTSALLSEGTVTTTVTVGGRSATFVSTNRVADQVPDAFTVAPVNGAALRSQVTSAPIALAGIDARTPVSVTGGGSIGINCEEPFFNFEVAIGPTQTFCVRATSAAADLTSTTVTLRVGPSGDGAPAGSPVTADFVITTGETEPDPFPLTDVVAARPGQTVVFPPITVTGITGPALISLSPQPENKFEGALVIGEFSVGCTGIWTVQDSLVEPGQQVCVRVPAATTVDTSTVVELQVGGAWSCSAPISGGSADESVEVGLTQQDGRAVCRQLFFGAPVGRIIGSRLQRTGARTADFTARTAETVPGGSGAVDPWLLVALLPLLGARRRQAFRA